MAPRNSQNSTRVAQICFASAVALISILFVNQAVLSHEQKTNREPEEIYIARSLRLTRIKPTDYCKKAGDDFEATAEDTYHFLSVATRTSDGRVTSTNAGKIGDLRACYGRTATPGTSKFFAEGQLAGIAFKGMGDCIMMKSISPAEGIVPFRCYLEITSLPDGYVGGLLTTNTTNSKIMTGEATDPPGYTMPSIATVRIWRK